MLRLLRGAGSGTRQSVSVPSAQVPQAATGTWTRKHPLENALAPAQVRRCTQPSSPHFSRQRSQPACSPAQRGESPRLQTGHMDNHLRLITCLCQRDGPQTSGSDKPPLLPQPLPEMFYQMLQEKIQAVQHRPGCWSVTQLSRLTPGSRSAPAEEVWCQRSFSMSETELSPFLPLSLPREEFTLKSGTVPELYRTFHVILLRCPAPFIHGLLSKPLGFNACRARPSEANRTHFRGCRKGSPYARLV